jgi:outer membrane protein assembly factor BamE (lipoprotein component of BamABCDE complex)
VKALTEQVRALQQRVDRLEGRRTSAAPAATPAPAPATVLAPTAGYVSPEAALKATWRKIRPDMARSEVVALLGEPSKEFELDGRRGWYYYYPGTGAGSVFFTDDGRVSSRQSPFGLGW